MAKATEIKKQIRELLEELMREQVIGEVHYDDFNVGVLDRDYAKYPAAIVTSPSIDARTETNRENMRTYTFEIVFVQKAENIGKDVPEAIEDLVETILKKFDDDMLTGATSKLRSGGADGGVEPSASTPEAVVSRSKTYIVFSVFVRANAIYP